MSDATFPSSHQKYFDAADKLLAGGEKPTAKTVHELAGGSMTTCNEALQNWWQHLSDRVNHYSAHPDLDTAVVDLARDLMKTASSAAEKKWAKEKTEFLKRAEKYETHIRELDELVAEAYTRQTEKLLALEEKEERIKQKDNEIAGLMKERGRQQDEIDSLTQEAAELNQQLEVATQTIRDNTLKSKLDAEKDAALREQVAALQESKAELEGQAKEAEIKAQGAEEKCALLATQLGKATEMADSLQKSNEHAAAKLAQIEAARIAENKSYEKEIAQLGISAQAENKAHEKEVAQLERALAAASQAVESSQKQILAAESHTKQLLERTKEQAETIADLRRGLAERKEKSSKL